MQPGFGADILEPGTMPGQQNLLECVAACKGLSCSTSSDVLQIFMLTMRPSRVIVWPSHETINVRVKGMLAGLNLLQFHSTFNKASARLNSMFMLMASRNDFICMGQMLGQDLHA